MVPYFSSTLEASSGGRKTLSVIENSERDELFKWDPKMAPGKSRWELKWDPGRDKKRKV